MYVWFYVLWCEKTSVIQEKNLEPHLITPYLLEPLETEVTYDQPEVMYDQPEVAYGQPEVEEDIPEINVAQDYRYFFHIPYKDISVILSICLIFFEK